MAKRDRIGTTERLVRVVAEEQARTEKALQELSREMAAFRSRTEAITEAIMESSRRDDQRYREEANRIRGELANRLGTIVEDIVAPNVPGVLRRYFGVTSPLSVAQRVWRARAGERGTTREFDVVAYSESLFFLVEAKITPKPEYVAEFVAFLPEVPLYFPEAVGRKLVPILASLQVPENVVTYLTRHGVYCMVMGEDTMVLANHEEVRALARLPPDVTDRG